MHKKIIYALKLPNEVRNIWNFNILVWMLHVDHIKGLMCKRFNNNVMNLWCHCLSSKPQYFEMNGPVCEGSVSNLSSNPLKLLPWTMFVKWWQHAKSHPFWRTFELNFISKAIKLKKIIICIKIDKWSQKRLKYQYVSVNA